MGLMDGIEKLINEHGSSLILRERISLANDKYAALEKRAADVKEENDALKIKLMEIQSENERLEDYNKQLMIQAENLEKSRSSHNNSLDKEKVEILMTLANQEWSLAKNIARSLGISIQVIQFHLDELENNEMVSSRLSMGEREEWTLNHEGRRYLIKNKLIS